MGIIESLMAVFTGDPVTALIILAIGVVIGIIIDKVISMSMMGGMI